MSSRTGPGTPDPWSWRLSAVASRLVVGGSNVRWGFTLAPTGAGTILTESWQFLPAGIAMFEEKFGADAQVQIADRTQQALDGIPTTLAAIKRIAESIEAGEDAGS